MKKVLSLLLALSICALACGAFVSCDEPIAPEASTQTEPSTEANTEPGTEVDAEQESEADTEQETEINTEKVTGGTTAESTEATTESAGTTTESTETKAESTETKTESTETMTESTETTTESTETTTESTEATTESTETTTESTETTTESTETTTEFTEATTESTETTTESTETTPESTETTPESTGTTTESPETTTESTETTGGSTVEKTQWEKLFSTDSFALYFDSGMVNQRFRFDGDNLYLYIEYSGEVEEVFIEYLIEENEYWITEEVYFEGNWVKGLDNFGSRGKNFAFRDDFFYSLADHYDDFTYDDESKTYAADAITISSSGFENTATDVIVQFENGKLTQVSYAWGGITFLINEVGAVEVEIPTADCSVTEEEWESIWSGNDFENVEIRHIAEYGDIVNRYVYGMSVIKSMYFTENAISLNNGSYVVKSNGVWYEIVKAEGEYECVEVTEQYVEENYTVTGTIGAELAGKYSSFTYNAENEYYVGELDGQECRIYFANGKVAFVELISAEGEKTAYMFCYYGRITEGNLDLPYVTLPDGTVIGQY